MDKERVRSFIEGHEGRRYQAYADSEGILTIGVGFNLEQVSARTRIEALGVDYDALCAKQVSLTDAQIDRLLGSDIDTALTEAALLVPHFWDQPDGVQIAMIDMIFNLGGPRFSKFVKLISALEEKDYWKAADEMANSKWAKQVPNRAADDIALVRGCAT